MDEVATICGISKKTLYNHFANKYDLVEQVVSELFVSLAQNCRKINDQAENAIVEVMMSLGELETYYTRVDYRMLSELKKYYHKIWNGVSEFTYDEGTELIVRNIVRGQKEGLYHINFDNQLIAEMRLAQLSYIHKSSGRPDFRKLFHQHTLHYLMGISTQAGRDELAKYLNHK